MRAWDDFVDFVRGTRERPPPGPKRPAATVLLLVASLLHLPIVYVLVGRADVWPVLSLVIGLLAMGLAWSSGVSLEGRRPGTVRILALCGLAEAGLLFVPMLADALGGARWLLAGIALLSAGALFASR